MAVENKTSDTTKIDIINSFIHNFMDRTSGVFYKGIEARKFLEAFKSFESEMKYLWDVPNVHKLYSEFGYDIGMCKPDTKEHKCGYCVHVPKINGLIIDNVLLRFMLEGWNVNTLFMAGVDISLIDFSEIHDYIKTITAIEISPEQIYTINDFPSIDSLQIMSQCDGQDIIVHGHGAIELLSIINRNDISVGNFGNMPRLTEMALTAPGHVIDFASIERFTMLEKIHIGGFTRIKSLQSLVDCKNLKKVKFMTGIEGTYDIDEFESLDKKSRKCINKKLK